MAKIERPADILDPRVAAARRDFLNGRITRREMLFRAAAAGAGAMTMGMLLNQRVGAQATPAGTPGASGEPGSTIQVPSDLRTDLGGASIKFVGHASSDTEFPWEQAALAKFTQATGINVELVPGDKTTTERLQSLRQQMAAQSSDYDVYMIDVIWPGIIANFAVDLTQALSATASGYLPAIIKNNTVDGKLIAMPWYTDAGILYYRTDLMEKYSLQVPATYDELAQSAQTVLNGEKASNPQFIGFMFQGAAYEGLTCNGVEWLASSGGGTITDEKGNPTINNPQAIAALDRAKGWVNTITPQSVTNAQEQETLNQWLAGSVAFARNWPYMFAASQVAASSVAGKVDVAILPKGSGPDAKNADTLGGWNMFVSKFSKSQDAAIEFSKYMASEGVQRSLAIENSHAPTLSALYDDPAVVQAQPLFGKLKDVFVSGTVARPSTPTGANYDQVSQSFFQNVNAVLAGSLASTEAVSKIESDIKNLSSGL